MRSRLCFLTLQGGIPNHPLPNPDLICFKSLEVLPCPSAGAIPAHPWPALTQASLTLSAFAAPKATK